MLKFTSIKIIHCIIIFCFFSLFSCCFNHSGIILEHSVTNAEVSLREKRTVLKTIKDKMIYGKIIAVNKAQILTE